MPSETPLTGITFHSMNLYNLAAKSHARCLEARSKGTKFLDDAVTAVILAVASLECFINEFAALAERFSQQTDPLSTLGFVWSELEKLPVQSKYLVVARLLGRPFDKGAVPYQEFALLVRLRNELIHLKPTAVVEFSDGNIAFQGPKIFKDLIDKKLTHKLEPGVPPSWHALIKTTELAAWACNTAATMVKYLFSALPEGNLKEPLKIVLHTGFKEVSS